MVAVNEILLEIILYMHVALDTPSPPIGETYEISILLVTY